MASTIARFVRSTRLRRRLAYGIASVTTHAVVVGALCKLVDWLFPAVTGLALALGFGWLALVVAFYGLNRGLSLHRADGTLGLQDRLVTWWSIRDRRADPMTRWLEEDLERAIDRIPAQRRGQLWRRPLRRLIFIVPLLLIVWWIGPLGQKLFLPSDYGVSQQADRGPRAGNGRTPGEQKIVGLDPQRGDHDPKADPEAPDEPDAKNDEDPPRDEVDQPPRPIPELPAKDQFVIPKFIGKGLGRVGKAKVAVVEDVADPATQKAQEEAAKKRRAERRREFEAAAEQALRMRHVPPSERPFVKRYFAELLKEAR